MLGEGDKGMEFLLFPDVGANALPTPLANTRLSVSLPSPVGELIAHAVSLHAVPASSDGSGGNHASGEDLPPTNMRPLLLLLNNSKLLPPVCGIASLGSTSEKEDKHTIKNYTCRTT